MRCVLTCVHHIQWVRPVEGGLHQCILCTQIVGRKDVYPRLEDLPEAARRWEEHERRSAVAKEAAAAPAARTAAPSEAGASTGPASSERAGPGAAKDAAAIDR